MSRFLWSLVVGALLMPFSGAGVAAEEPASVVAITVDGASRNVMFQAPSATPAAVVVMFPGGDGWIGVGPGGAISKQGNFLIRTRAQWLGRRLMFVAVDAPSPGVTSRGDRVGPAMQHAIAEVVRLIRQRTKAPIWLLGTSAGAPAAMAGAASLPQGSIKGVVISSPVSMPGSHDSVFDVPLAKVAVPVLIQINTEDACRLTPPANAARIQTALVSSPAAQVQAFSGGLWPKSEPCEAFARHGFYGIEDQVVNAAADWIVSH
jgi:alpha-beta hydrolase superfamily lysophospholipase